MRFGAAVQRSLQAVFDIPITAPRAVQDFIHALGQFFDLLGFAGQIRGVGTDGFGSHGTPVELDRGRCGCFAGEMTPSGLILSQVARKIKDYGFLLLLPIRCLTPPAPPTGA